MEEQEVYSLLVNEIPRFASEFQKNKDRDSVYELTQHFVNYTKDLIEKKNHADLKICFQLAEKILKEGNRTVKNAIENVYIYSLANIIAQHDLVKYLPPHLHDEYKKQTCSCGI